MFVAVAKNATDPVPMAETIPKNPKNLADKLRTYVVSGFAALSPINELIPLAMCLSDHE
jgi:hypothetical protein